MHGPYKDNQPQLHEAIIDYFDVAIKSNDFELAKIQFEEIVDAGHGRIEVRRHYLSTCLATLPKSTRWKGVKSIAMVESVRTNNGKTSLEKKFCSVYKIYMRLPWPKSRKA